VTSSGITAREPQQNPVLVFSITLAQKRVRRPVWIILVLLADLVSVGALLVKRRDQSNLPSTLELVCDVTSLFHAHTQTKFRKCKYKFSRTHIDGTRARTHTYTLLDHKKFNTTAVTPGPAEIWSGPVETEFHGRLRCLYDAKPGFGHNGQQLTPCLEAEVRQGWKGGKDQGVRTSKIQFNVVRKECDISVDHLYK
jgi:hypothetical protein